MAYLKFMPELCPIMYSTEHLKLAVNSAYAPSVSRAQGRRGSCYRKSKVRHSARDARNTGLPVLPYFTWHNGQLEHMLQVFT